MERPALDIPQGHGKEQDSSCSPACLQQEQITAVEGVQVGLWMEGLRAPQKQQLSRSEPPITTLSSLPYHRATERMPQHTDFLPFLSSGTFEGPYLTFLTPYVGEPTNISLILPPFPQGSSSSWS